MIKNSDILIIGGGIAGLLTAYYLSKETKHSILVLDSGDIDSTSTSKSAGMVLFQTESELLTDLSIFSRSEYQSILNEAGDIGFSVKGSILFTTNKESLKRLQNMSDIQNKRGINTKILNTKEINKLVPDAYVKDMLKGVYAEQDACLEPIKLLNCLENVLRRRNVNILRRENVSAIKRDGRNYLVTSYSGTEKSVFSTKKIVNAAGSMAPDIAYMVGEKDISLVPNKRHIVTFSPKEAKSPVHFPILENIDDEFYFKPHGNSILVGVGATEFATKIECEENSKLSTNSAAEKLAKERFQKRFPTYTDWSMTNSWVGVRPMNDNEIPNITFLSDNKDIVHIIGLSSFGISTGPACAYIAARMISNQAVPQSLLPAFNVMSNQKQNKDNKPGDYDFLRKLDLKTPCYIYDIKKLSKNIDEIKTSFSQFQIFYAVKANPNAKILEAISNSIDGMDISSLGELAAVKKVKNSPGSIIYGGPGKSIADLKEALKNGVDLFSIESERELLILNEISEIEGLVSKVLVRINSNFSPSGAKEYMSGSPSQFGIDQNSVEQILNLKLSNIEFKGIHVHSASQVLAHNSIVEYYRDCTELFIHLRKSTKADLDTIDFGGGLGIPYSEFDVALDLKLLGKDGYKAINEVLSNNNLDTSKIRLILELGRSIVGDAGVFVGEVIETKISKNQHYIILDGGIAHFSRPAMPWAEQHPVQTVPLRNQGYRNNYKIVGTSCLPADIVCQSAALHPPENGDLIVFENAGAYGESMSLVDWCKKEKAITYILQNGVITS